MSIKDKFLTYISYDTQSDPDSNSYPSTKKQFALAEVLVNELKELGLQQVMCDEFCYVYGILPGNNNVSTKIGLIAHMDTATEVTGKNVNPQIIDKYDGSDIKIDESHLLSPKEYPSLNKAIGHTLITTDGKTLLGADDKAGIAIIMETLEKLVKENLPHPTIYVCFTPDEEIGRGTDKFNYDFFQADFAYTIDGGDTSLINFENFNAASAVVEVTGLSIHPGSAKDKMINSQHIAMEFHSLLDTQMRPEHTSGYQGFNHLNNMEGSVEKTTLNYIIRNHNMNEFKKQMEDFRNIENFLNHKYPTKPIKLTITESYLNMRELVLSKPIVLEYPIKALKRCKIEPSFDPIRGGTDGARLSFGGLITPNLGTGSYNHHGVMEYADIDEMNKMVEVVITMLSIIE